MEFHPIRAKDKEVFDKYFSEIDSRNCDMCFSTLYLWGEHYGLTWTQEEGMLLVKSESEEGFVGFYFPIGTGDPGRALDSIEEYFRERNLPVRIFCVSKENEAWLEKNRPGVYRVTYNRDLEDYIYLADNLIRLSGRKYHGKKNHVNKFKRACPDWTYEPITDDNRQECLEMLREWKKVNSVDKDFDKYSESCVARKYLLNMESLGQKGGLIRTGGRIVAFTIGEPLNSDTFVVHIEKAFSDVPGAYAIINQQFLEHEAQSFTYINREDDAGDEGLRQAKLSYRPVMMIEKGMAVKKNGGDGYETFD